MSKYIDAELLRKEIERRITDNTFGAKLELIDILAWLDTLSEEPDKSLEEAAEEKYPVYWKSYPKDGIVRSESSYDTNKQCRDAFIAGAEWQKEQMLKEAVEGYVAQRAHGKLYAKAQIPDEMNLEFGDKVRIIVLKAEEE